MGAPKGYAQPVAPVEVIQVATDTIRESVQLSGTVTAERDAALSVAISGLVSSLQADAGDVVERGDQLLELDAELATYQSQAAEAAMLQSERALADARRRLEEARKLAPQQSIAETVVKGLEAEVLEDEAAVRQAQADASYQRGILERHTLNAPFAGVISARYVNPGEWVTPGTAVMDLVSIQRLRIDVQLPEDNLTQLDGLNSAQFSLGSNREEMYLARISAIVPVSDPTSRTALVRIVPQEAVEHMRPGMSARVILQLETGRNGVVIPRDAVLRFADGRVVVWVVDQAAGLTEVEERRVDTGRMFDGKVEIVNGLAAGEFVIVRGNEALRSGQRVNVAPLAGF